jgi:hypothetical protein
MAAGPRERRSPGLTALFDALAPDGRHSLLDLGPASGAHLALLSRYASQIRFANLLPTAAPGPEWEESVRALAPNLERPYDVVLAWDVLDRLDGQGRSLLVARLTEVTAPRARLYAIVGGENADRSTALTFTLVDFDRVLERPTGVTKTPGQPLLPAQTERALAPFEVTSAFMLRTGAREYVAMKQGRWSPGGRRGVGK